MKISVKIRIINWWFIFLSLFEIFFGLGPYWLRGNWTGDYLLATYKLLLIFFIGIISFISGIFLLKQKSWAWTLSKLLLILVILIVGSDYCIWLFHAGSILSFFSIASGSHYDFLDVFYASDILFILLISLILLLVNRKGFDLH
jgi:hypothetical protein